MIIPNLTRVTITLPSAIVQKVDARTRNRSRFILTAVERELQRTERAALRRSLAHPHSESAELAEAGLQAWADTLPDEDIGGLVDVQAGQAVQWTPGHGWMQRKGAPSSRISRAR